VRFPARPLALAKSKADYLDIHLYSTDADSLAADLKSVEFDEVRGACTKAKKPIIMGEFGAFKANFSTASAAAQAMASHLKWTREAGFSGFLYWTYDTDEQIRLWNALSGEGQIMKTLSAALSN
jgi:endo-1,4-beta-mannosidase